MKPTEEQQKCLELFQTGGGLKINAFAGAGKTTTLKLLSENTRKSGIYLAFNKAIAGDASQKFPQSVKCLTTHAMAFHAMKSQFSIDKMTTSINANALAERLELKGWKREDYSLAPRSQGFLILETIRKFTQGTGLKPDLKDVPTHGKLALADEEIITEVKELTLGNALNLWESMRTPNNPVPLGHDGYLKLWALSNPRLNGDFIMLDEAQDSNPVILDVLSKQTAQIVYVGDKHQQIYEWRGAVNAMEVIQTPHTAYLTQSFRFGEGIANAASQILKYLGEEHNIRGNPELKSYFAAEDTNTILTRTNATAITETLQALGQGLNPHIVGGTAEMIRLLKGVESLKGNQPTDVLEFFGFQNWHEVVELVKSGEGEQIKTFVNLVEKHGEKSLMYSLRRTAADEKDADIIISTAHKAKGREWSSVRLANDFLMSKSEEAKLPASEIRLFYVAATRAKEAIIIPENLIQAFDIKKTNGLLPSKRRKAPEPPSRTEPPPAVNPSPNPGWEVTRPEQQPIKISIQPVTFAPLGFPWYWWAIGGLVGFVLFG